MSDDTDIRLTLTAGDEVTLPAVGRYYRILEAIGDVWVAIDDGPLVKRFRGVGQHREAGFSRLRLYSETTQSVHIAVSDGRVDDSRLSLQSGTVVQIDGGELSSGYFGNTISYSTPIEMLAPGANVNGARIFGVNGISASGYLRIAAKATEPASFGDVNARTLALIIDGSGGVSHSSYGFPLKLPAGLGIYALFSNVGGAGRFGAEWELL